jgi:heterodisulfide reductase subunit A-like polyferredoxin
MTPVGAVMVVGGGIAGMQSALDLADQGFKVYLVEQKSAVGGKMAQLDKTFPTNDCAMCTISPKLVEVGRHPNIQVMTDTQVLDIQGQVGDFTAYLEQAPRYVDTSKCVSCGDCTQVCPVIVPDRFNEGLAPRRAIYKLYPQAVPNAFAIEKRGIAPCRDACPAGQRAQGYIALIREGRWQDALRVIKMDNPFPGICGRICNHRCETACNRGQVDEPINIRALKRFVTDKVYSQPRQPVEPAPRLSEQRVAIIGAGPCGLTAAQDLARAGYAATVFEAMPVAGGMLRLGVPEYRLPTEIIEREVQDIIDLGVDLQLNHRVNNLDEVFQQGFDAVLIAVGAHEGIRLPIPGADLQGVLVNTHFLRDVRLGLYASGDDGSTFNLKPATLGKHVLVLGGGNVAVDCARTAVRLGCESVGLACLESREQMPAHPWEVEAAEAEGVSVYPGLAFERVVDDGHGRTGGVECMQVASFSFDERGRLHVEKVAGSDHTIPCDTVIFSVGQRAGLAFIPGDANVGLTDRQTIAINPNTLATSRPGVFAAGDCISGTAFVIESVDRGHTAAQSIIRYLRGEALEPAPRPELPVVRLSQQELAEKLARGEIHPQPRVPMPQLAVDQRRGNFAEVEGGYDDASAQAEAARCLACGICSECMSCVFACGAKAIDHDMLTQAQAIHVGAVILAPGYQIYHAEQSEEFGYGRYPNVITALQFERLLSASGPTLGHVQRPSDGQAPRRVAFLQCVGSRDQSHDYCSAVCCMYATKEAMIAKEHDPELDVHVFMMDMRAFSKGYWSYFERARGRYGIHYHRCRVSGLREDPQTHELILQYSDGENGTTYLRREKFDLVVLSVGMQAPPGVRELGRRIGIELDEHGFCRTGAAASRGDSPSRPYVASRPDMADRPNPLETSRRGIYAVGTFREPKDIPESVVEASGAAAAAAAEISTARFTLTTEREYPPERDVRGEPPRVGVFVCHCGSNIAGFLDVKQVTQYAASLPNVTHAEANMYTCSQDSIRHITNVVKERGLNRVVVASCTPLTHAPLFQDSLRSAGLNPFLFEMANIRNQCSWVHSHDWDAATAKARDLVRMAVGRAALLEPQYTIELPVQRAALVVGGGVAGMTAALSLAEQGFPVHLVEVEADLGGNLRRVFTAAPALNGDGTPESPQETLERLVRQVQADGRICVHLDSRVVASSGFMGNFTSVIQGKDGTRQEIAHGAAILATGAREYRGPDYGYGSHPHILTQMELEQRISESANQRLDNQQSLSNLRLARLDTINNLQSVVMIQCVGPAEKFCSRICCTVALKNALVLKERNPDAQVTILYRDIRTYGFKERLYTEARRRGVVFVRYEEGAKPEVRVSGSASQRINASTEEPQPLIVSVRDATLGRVVELHPDLVVLSMPVVPNPEMHALSALFKVPADADGFFLEAHVKLRPVDFATDGVFMAGMAHYPKLLDESIIQAQAAAARAARVLSREALIAGGRVAVVDEARCTGCLTCVRICPFHVPRIQANLTGVGNILGAAYIEPAVCQGCGQCAAECPARAIQLMHYTDAQMMAKVRALMISEQSIVRSELRLEIRE